MEMKIHPIHQRKKYSLSLRNRLLLPSLIAGLAAVLFLSGFFHLRLRNALRTSLDSRIEEGLIASEKLLETTLEQYHSVAFDLCSNDHFLELAVQLEAQEGRDREARENIQEMLKNVCSWNKNVCAVMYCPPFGEPIIYDKINVQNSETEKWLPDYVPTFQKNERWRFELPRRAGTNTYLDFYFFTVQRQVIDYNHFSRGLGSVVLCVDEEALRGVFKGIDKQFSCLMDRNNRVVGAPEKWMLGKTVNEKRTSIGDQKYDDYTIGKMDGPMENWYLIEFFPLTLYQQTLRSHLITMLWFILLFSVAIIISARWGTRPTILFTKDMVDVLEQVGKGDFKARIDGEKYPVRELETISDGLNRTVEQAGELLDEVIRDSEERRRAEISALEAQIDPHFLYNTLDTINWKAIEKEQFEISELVVDLADILRYAIKNAGAEVSLGQEVAWVKKYIRLQQEKLGVPIQVFTYMDSEAAGLAMHKLLLQPLVENCIKHGLMDSGRDPILLINGQVEDDHLVVRVRDNGVGVDHDQLAQLNQETYHKGNHFGVENVRKRLELYYEKDATLVFSSEKGEYLEAMIILPVIRLNDQNA